MIRARMIPAKTGRPFSLSMRGRYRLADLCHWLEISDEDREHMTRMLLAWPHGRKATTAGSHVLVTGENFMWAAGRLSAALSGGPQS